MRKLGWDHLKRIYAERADHYQPFIASSFERMAAVIDAARDLPIGCITTELSKAIDELEEEQPL